METPTLYFFPLVVVFLLLSMACSAKTQRDITTDQASLLSFKAHITLYPHHILQSNWSTSSSVCDWVGVTCGLRHRRVTALDISNMNVTGTLPAQLGNLSFLAWLDLSFNNFHGDLPEQLANLRRLRVMVLDNNSFSGEMPSWLGSVSELRVLSLAYNHFAGFTPPSISNLTKLEILELTCNSLQGNIPSEIFSISTLEHIRMSINFLSGDLPIDMCNSLPRLKRLGLSSNALGGRIPPSISNCSQLRVLSLSINNFGGGIPGEIGKLEKLEVLFLGGNGFSKGIIPQEIGNLRNLKELAMEKTQRIGSIPLAMFNISALQHLYLDDNDLEGELQEEIGNLYKLEVINLNGNKLSGSIPLALFNISTLQIISLSMNDLEGKIPEEIGKLYKLEEIQLYDNRLSGFIPMDIFNLSNLRVLLLGWNQLVGTLPSNMGNGIPHLGELGLFGNNLGGVLPNSISNSTRLQSIDLQENEFIGEIPHSLGNLRLLSRLRLNGNNLTSPGMKFITSLTKCQYLRVLDVRGNFLDGNLPVSVGNLSALENFYAVDCQIRGSIPDEFGNLSRLIELELSNNHLTGAVPPTMKALQLLDIANNSIQGSTLYTVCELQNLFSLNLDHNNISGPIPNCLDKVISLQHLSIHNSGLTSIPPSFWNLKNLIQLNLSSNSINGPLPKEIGNLKVATQIDLSTNQFIGNIPNVFADLLNVESLSLSHNRLVGSIPDSLGKIVSLEDLDLSHNNLSGSIPKSLEDLSYLKNFNVSINNLRGEIPFNGPFKNFTSGSFEFNDALCGESRFQVPPCPVSSTNKRRRLKKTLEVILIPLGIVITILSMVFIFLLMRYRKKDKDSSRLESFAATTSERISYFELHEATNKYNESNLVGSGSFGSVYRGILKDGTFVAVKVFNLQLDFSMNQFTGNISNMLADLTNLESLFLSHNKLGGSMPDSLGKIVSLKDLDLSHNNLSGSIPKSLETLKYLKDFNVSFNNLEGEIPSNGPFKNFTSQSFEFNDALCGDSRFQVPPCPSGSTKKRRRLEKILESILIPLAIAMTMLAMVFVFLLMRYQRKDKDSSRLESFSATTLERISYYELLEATNKYNESNLLGSGSFGSVYRGILKDRTFVAVKVFNLQLEGAFKSFETECEVLRNLRHRNLTKVITCCCTEDFKALVLEYMPNGSLEKWLYSHNYFLDLMQRLNIMIDVACALEYLHHGYSTPLVHCDLKPSNILLDEDMVARVSDFGITKLLGEGQSISHTNTLATLGYIAPEYGLEGLVSTRCDVYSFGIMMMEVFTRKKPSDDMFAADLSLKSWVSNFTPHAIIQVVDANLLIPQEQYLSEKLKCLSSIMELALSCSVESPNERINMRDVVAMLKKIKLEFLAYCGGI